MIDWLNLLSKKRAECARLTNEVAALKDDLADAMARFKAGADREQRLLYQLHVARELLKQEKETSDAYRRMNARLEREIASRDEIDEMLRDAEGDW